MDHPKSPGKRRMSKNMADFKCLTPPKWCTQPFERLIASHLSLKKSPSGIRGSRSNGKDVSFLDTFPPLHRTLKDNADEDGRGRSFSLMKCNILRFQKENGMKGDIQMMARLSFVKFSSNTRMSLCM
ncbi:hypothetical protein CEXT_382291 [Caerostris extrusa]|uniref:Uncharacterized protein n=1 Tax=Caerostris extrusa TaxID=172846 RepID=A0AAV4PZB6_CAEEX|nr:hypothetical protein CEXT_382291 [Caerostris extrusa]